MSRHEHKWNPNTLVCVSCGITYKDAIRQEFGKGKPHGFSDTIPEITQLERGVKA